MTTVDLRSWTPTAVPRPEAVVGAGTDGYAGKHRKPGMRGLSVMRMMYRPRHRAP